MANIEEIITEGSAYEVKKIVGIFISCLMMLTLLGCPGLADFGVDLPNQTPDPSVENYYILDTKERKRYGPFDKDDFMQKREELGISKDIELKPIDKYR